MKMFGRNSDVVLAFALIFMLGLMLIPLPAGFLDFFLALSITVSVLIFVVSLFIQSPLDISIFPGLLLISTLFRLSLNISSTRLILIDGYAGKVIETFGQFVVSGNYVVGFIIFIILLIVQFMVIVKGSGRISEVAARFTLDAMPGKQMAIDADLNTGLITEADARKRRDNISREAEFYGAMDGAGKFVKGDAIAGLIISVINIVGGFIIGVGQRDLSIVEALQQYTILTIGDGLVSQIPALLISTAAGMVVTRSAAGTPLDTQIKSQLLANPRVLGIVAATVIMFSFLPGMPTIPFVFIGSVLGVTSFVKNRNKNNEATVIEEEIVSSEKGEDVVEQYLQVDPIEIEIGYGLISLVDESQGGNLFNKISTTRKFIALEFGVLIPPVRVRDNLQLSPNEYIIKIKGNIVSSFEIHPDRFLAMNPGGIEDQIDGMPTKDPAFGLQSFWVTREEKDRAELLGFTVVDAISVLSTHLQETLKTNFDKILSRQAVKQLLENLKKDYPAVIDDISVDVLPLGTIQKVLQNLLRELIPIKDLVQIIEALIDYSKVTKNIDVLTEYVRHSLNNTIANLYKDGNGIIHAAAISEKLEAYITASFQNQKDAVQTLGLNPVMLSELKNKMQIIVDKFDALGYRPVFITSATIRPYFYRLINSSFQSVTVLSYTELPSQIEIEFIDNLEISNAH
ncbi:MAG: flagellar biosynthesis protein FlhA [Ignavibacterium sp.]|nr:flagellar biosynthesis protein FlhA [Ignavibacterium sp.]